eukprot:scaffold5192_cov114-Isochrysis_galbana.AAC.5
MKPKHLVLALACVSRSRALTRTRMREIEKQETEIRQRMRARRRVVASLAASAAEEHSRPQRVVHRAAGKWRGSTLFGYLHRGDDQTFYGWG